MIEALAVALFALGALLYQDHRNRRERDTYLRAVSLAIREGSKDREAAAKERDKLLTRIQAPEAASFIDIQPAKQYASMESDEEGWEAIREMNGRAD